MNTVLLKKKTDKTVTRTFDKESNKQSYTETLIIFLSRLIKKQHVTSLSNYNTNSMQNDTVDNQDYLNKS